MGFDPKTQYTLTNDGTSFLQLDQTYVVPLVNVNARNLTTSRLSSDSLHLWQIRSARTANRFNICQSFQNLNYCIDILGAEPRTTVLAGLDAYQTGQHWNFIPAEGGSYRLQNDYSGSKLFLDVSTASGIPIMTSGDTAGQRWTIARNSAETATPSPTSAGSSNGDGGLSKGGGGLSKEAKIGTGVGVASLFVAIVAAWITWRRKN